MTLLDPTEIVMEVQVKQNTADINKIKKVVFGNGEIGMGEQIRKTAGSVEDILEMLKLHIEDNRVDEDKKQKKKEKIQIVFIGALIANAFIFIGSTISMFLKFYPILLELSHK